MGRKFLYLVIFLCPGLALAQSPENLCHLVADSGGGNGGDDLLTVADRTNFNASTNETNIGTGTGTNNIEAAAMQPGTGVFFALDGNRLGRISLSNGVFTPVSNNDLGGGDGALGNVNFNDADGLTFDPGTGVLYASVRRLGSDLLIQVNPATGARVANAFGTGIDYVVIPAFGDLNDTDDLAVDPNTGQMFAIISDGGVGNHLVRLNKSTGALTNIGALGADDMEGLSFDPSGSLYGSTGFALFDINKTTGLASNPRPLNNGSDYESVNCLNFDIDEDGLFDFEEPLLGTDPQNPDTDADGLLDGTEVRGGNNPTNPLDDDSDNDGLLDGVEDADADGSFESGETNPNDPDTDNDGLTDGEEVLTLGTNPLNVDTDGDAISDFVETDGGFLTNTDNDGPIDALDNDSDNDTVPDLQEGVIDTDTDGKPNWRDPDDDNDTLLTSVEAEDEAIFGSDVDNDGKLNHLDTDSDKDNLLDSVEGRTDSDGDGLPDYLDPDGLPIAVPDSASTNEDTPVLIPVLANDIDIEDLPITVSVVLSSVNGSLVVNPDNTITYTPNPNFHGVDVFIYRVTDGDNQSSTAVVSISVLPVADALIAVDDVLNGLEDSPLVIPKASLLANDINVDGGVLSLTSVTGATNGFAAAQGAIIVFTPAPNFSGVASFSYTASNGSASDTALVTINVAPVNDAPVANNDSASTNEDTPLTLSVASLLANDTDIDGPALSLSSVSNPVNGVVTLQGSSIVFTPSQNFFGAASFTYTASDGSASDTAVVQITVNPVNDPPVALDDEVEAGESSVVLFVLDNDTDIDGDALLVVSITQGASGAVTLNADGTITYTTSAPEVTDSFTYTISDGNGGTDSATVTVSVDTDRDDDGLSNTEEEEIGTDPDNADTDEDLLTDGVEVLGENETNPLDPDSDNDLLEDGEEDEDQNGALDEGETNPNNADTDDGGVNDGSELDNGTNPLDPSDDIPDEDLDDDGLTNDEEEKLGTNPKNPDTDNDNLFDGTEVLGENPTNPLDADTDDDALADGQEDSDLSGSLEEGESDPNNPDSDGDALLDGTETELGTDPNDADTDDGGVQDGEEVNQNNTDPLDPSDDLRTPGYQYIGGGGCAVDHTPTRSALGLWVLLLVFVWARRPR